MLRNDYILLCCIEIHDIGNIFGRYKHEQNAVEILKKARGICGRDTIETLLIKKIAESHGGKLENGDKDKISLLEVSANTLFGEIRPRLLASILRFADELADDRTRCLPDLLKQGRLPKQSEVFHAYAYCLQSVKIEHSEMQIKLTFSIPDNFLSRKFGKINEEVFLIDEIYERLIKMHNERVYCMRFSKKSIDIEKIRVHMEFYSEEHICEVHDKLVFDISDNGYPNSLKEIFDICPDLIKDSERLDGMYFEKIQYSV